MIKSWLQSALIVYWWIKQSCAQDAIFQAGECVGNWRVGQKDLSSLKLCIFYILWINLQRGLWNYNRLPISQSHLGALSYKLKCRRCEEALGMHRHERMPTTEGYVALTLPAASWWIYFLVGNSFDSSISMFSVCVLPPPSCHTKLVGGGSGM